MKGFLLSIALLLVFIAPTDVLAQTGGLVPCNGPECQACHFVQLGQNLLVWFIKIMASVIAVVFAVGGLKMATAGGDTGKVSEAKGMMTNALIGFVILLSAWLIIDTVMKLVANPDAGAGGVKLGVWHTIECVAQPARTTAPVTTIPGSVTTAPSTTGGLSHADAVAQLGGISVVSSGNCTDRTNKSCTSLDGLQPTALSEIVGTIKACSGCNLQITAGTEIGHTNPCHQGGTCIDMRCAGGCTSDQVVQVSNSAKANGAHVVYETLSCSARDSARAQGLTAYCKSDPNYGHITGDHFSLYTQ